MCLCPFPCVCLFLNIVQGCQPKISNIHLNLTKKTQKSLFLGLKIPEKTPNFTFNKKTQIFSWYTQKSPKNPQIPDISPTGVKIPENVLFGDKIPMVGSPGSCTRYTRHTSCNCTQQALLWRCTGSVHLHKTGSGSPYTVTGRQIRSRNL